MPITIIHGDDIVLSRKHMQEEKNKTRVHHVFDADVDLSSIIQIVQGGELFDTEKRIFIENFFSKNKLNSAETKNIINYINKNTLTFDVFFWEDKKIQKNILNLFNKPTIKTFNIPQTIFLFLDNIKHGDYKNSISLFHKALVNTGPELIFFMLQRQFRLLIAISDKKTEKTVDEVLRLFPWQKGKIEKQAKLFSIAQLKDIYKRLYKIELAQKTGDLPYSLEASIDFLLLNI